MKEYRVIFYTMFCREMDGTLTCTLTKKFFLTKLTAFMNTTINSYVNTKHPATMQEELTNKKCRCRPDIQILQIFMGNYACAGQKFREQRSSQPAGLKGFVTQHKYSCWPSHVPAGPGSPGGNRIISSILGAWEMCVCVCVPAFKWVMKHSENLCSTVWLSAISWQLLTPGRIKNTGQEINLFLTDIVGNLPA